MKLLNPTTLKYEKAFHTQRAISSLLIEYFNKYGIVRKDLAKWQLTLGTEPFIGHCPAAPSIMGECVATNGIDALVVNAASLDNGNAAICHFRNFECFDSALQGELNQCLLPFEWWFRSHLHRYATKAQQASQGFKKVAKAVANKPDLSREQLLAIFQ